MDIGSGFGKPCFHAAMYAGCRAKGIEIVPARVSYCMDLYWQLDEMYKTLNPEAAPPAPTSEEKPMT